MKRFEFRLDKLQRLRERARERRRLAYAEAIEYRHRIHRQIEQLERIKAEEKAAQRSLVARPELPIDQIIQSRGYEALLSKFRLYLDRQMEQVQLVVEGRRQELVVAERDVRILEKLEAKLRQRYDAILTSSEAAELDEVASTAHLKRTREDTGGEKT